MCMSASELLLGRGDYYFLSLFFSFCCAHMCSFVLRAEPDCAYLFFFYLFFLCVCACLCVVVGANGVCWLGIRGKGV